MADDRRRAEVEDLVHRGLQLVVGHLLGAEGLDEQTHRGRLADGVGDLDLGTVGQAGRDDVLRDPAGGVGRGAVHLRRVLAGEGAATVPGHAAVGVDDDLPAGQARVTHRPADHEAAGRVDQDAGVLGLEAERLDLRRDDVLAQVDGEFLVQVHALGVLAGDHDGVQADRLVAVVLDGHLGLAVGTQVRNRAVLADLGQPAGQAVRQGDRQRHQLGRVRAGVAEHQALVTGALLVELVEGVLQPRLVGGVDTLRDVRGLRVDRHVDPAGVAVEALAGLVVPDLLHAVTDDLRDVDLGLGGHLAGHVDLTSGDHGLDRDTAARVHAQHRVQDAVADRVGHLVGVAFGHGLTGEQPTVSSHSYPRLS